MTHDHCSVQMKRLTILKGLPEDIVEYFAALEDVPDEVFTSAVGHALKTRQWFPTPAELRADCDAVKVSAPPREESRLETLAGGGHTLVIVNPLNGVELTIPVTRIWRFDCDTCLDGGWASHRCPSEPCWRRGDHDPHEWVERCACVDWNPTIRRRKDAVTKYSQAPEKVA